MNEELPQVGGDELEIKLMGRFLSELSLNLKHFPVEMAHRDGG